MKIAFVHPNLGIGGAERLVVDAALALQERGHTVEIFTAYHDAGHCFEETRSQLKVHVYGNMIPTSIFGLGFVVMAILKMIWISLIVRFGFNDYDVIFVDQVAAAVPFLKLTKAKVLFYCHFPDQLLTTRKTAIKKFYRFFIDAIEEKTTGMADQVVVNSRFTASVFKKTFKSLSHLDPKVVYPAVQVKSFQRSKDFDHNLVFTNNGEIKFVSINRFERKKKIELAIKAFGKLETLLQENPKFAELAKKIKLVVAGGYDPLVKENVEYHQELTQLVKELGLEWGIEFKPNIPFPKLVSLLHESRSVIYTPDFEHLGIVPLESMSCGVPVIAVNSGGPTETIVNNETGFLCAPDVNAFANAMYNLAVSPEKAYKMGKNGESRVKSKFDRKEMGEQLELIMNQLVKKEKEKEKDNKKGKQQKKK